MGLQLPGELVEVLGMIGYAWPEADEEKLFAMGQAWIGFAPTIQHSAQETTAAAQTVWGDSAGEAIEAFRSWWHADGNAPASLHDAANAATILGAGLIACAGIVLALKIQVIVQLGILAVEIAQAAATAVATAGASLAEIPIFQTITREIVGMLINQVIEVLLDA